VAGLWSVDKNPAAIVVGEGDVCDSEQGLNTEVYLNRLVSASRFVRVGGGRLMRLLVIGCLQCVAERGCVAGFAWVVTLWRG
jgi:hypothetical protein